MSKRILCFDWVALEGARKKKRKLHLEPQDDGVYLCPVESCLHVGFKSQRGARKHVNNKHQWFYYFDSQPTVKREDAQECPSVRKKASTHKQLAFSIDHGSGLEFVQWLQTPCGGCKKEKEAKQAAKRAMKFLMSCMGDCEDGVVAKESYIDCAVGSPSMLMKFLKVLLEEWGLKSTGALSYLQAITDLLDFRKCHGIPDSTLRMFAVTEVYLRRSKSTLYRKRNVEYSRNMNLESLIAERSWATLEDMEKVIPYHSPKYQELFEKAGNTPLSPLTTSELAFTTRFIITFLLLRVKCTRPMSLQHLTIDMINLAMENGGFVDQSEFKTSDQYGFDSLKFTTDALDIVKTYIDRIRPLCNPKCEFVLLTTNGTKYTAFCNALSLLTHEAIGKHITPTRYRAIVESESVVRLDKDKQTIISKDQKHSSTVARKYYQKKLSREVAEEGAEAMKELVGSGRENHTGVLASKLRDSFENPAGNSQTNALNSTESDIIPIDDKLSTCSKITDEGQGSASDKPIVIDENKQFSEVPKSPVNNSTLIEKDNIELKKEELDGSKQFLLFTTAEDSFLTEGFIKYAKSKKKWSDILKDESFQFQPGRTRDSIRVRATTLGLQKPKLKRKSKSK